ncbi:molybdate ABC transporter substrate-binding protein [Sphingomonas sp. SORGH_AS_0879]|uniref:molybdate ABC transporter substrate-binding protein n=1 Tax=Sphingomonas sp. SORGH_AS_0879 TaxID=3041790 RepID=UPI00278225C8|nr:molybdate ABC transporter substrate-binding protein [Sphingomonas sp. SORGH_AS_0879]MDQ1231048.1 molybdate transport system substrate-binding protein [Sphingomonas sp. SORGH_AS_0879]
MKPFSILALFGALSVSVPAVAQNRAPLVLAAASLQESMTAAADSWAKKGHPRPVISFAASSALARQVQAGGTADLFASADEEWMDVLQKDGLLAERTRSAFLGNRLVVIAPAGKGGQVTTRTLAKTLSAGPLAMADTDSVPAGKYGKAALEKLGAWSAVAPHVVRAENVRAALALVERGAAPYGIVYATDAKASPRVHVVGLFPVASHSPITYPLARLKASTNPQAEGFRRFLLSSEGKAIFRRYGFSTR